jgi:ribonuclease BN (tRNA processing enzyme)
MTAAVTLEFIGCGDAFASGGRFHTCFLVRGSARPFLIDCGASAPVALQRRGVDPSGICLVIVSHLHGDHVGGLPFLLMDAAYNRPRAEPLVVAGPRGIEASVLAALEALYPGAATRSPRVCRSASWSSRAGVSCPCTACS